LLVGYSPSNWCEQVGKNSLAQIPKWDIDIPMRIIALSTLKVFYEQSEFHDARTSLAQWYSFVKIARWESPADVKGDFGSASILKSGRAVFNIAGNEYRLVVKINYGYGVVYIRFIGTHEAYDRIDASEV